MATEIAHTTLILNDTSRELLKKLNFTEDIPEEANYIAFFDDGECCFLSELDTSGSFMFPHMAILSYYHTPVSVDI